MIGFGDPVFRAEENIAFDAGKEGGRIQVASRSTRAYTDYWQGVELDRARLADVPPLPDTADELRAVAKTLGAPLSDIHLGRDAIETTVNHAPLADYRIVYFATHGLVAGDIKGLGEPALLLSLPKKPSEFDDGLLTASDVALLKLNADWVVLSACNTAAGEKPGAEALSGLARAFFYAGAPLLVSHWKVDAQAAARITAETLAICNRIRGLAALRLCAAPCSPFSTTVRELPGLLGALLYRRRGSPGSELMTRGPAR